MNYVSNCCGSSLYMSDFLEPEDAICGCCLEHCSAVEEE